MAGLTGALPFRRPIPLRWSLAFFMALGVFSLLLPYQQLARAASALLAIGVGRDVPG